MLQASSTRLQLGRCDIGEPLETLRLLRVTWRATATGVGAPCGVWHMAGVLADGLLAQQGAASLIRVLGSKAHGAVWLHQGLAQLVVRVCASFSSITALLGGAGQANYSAANSYLDTLAGRRRTSGLVGVSLQWGPWAELGMASSGVVHKHLEASGLELLGLSEGLTALEAAMGMHSHAVVGVTRARWEVVVGAAGQVPRLLSEMAEMAALGGRLAAPGASRPAAQ